MSGSSVLVGTNIVLYLLSGEKAISLLLDGRHLFISEISELELLGYQGITKKEIRIIQNFLNDCTIVSLNQDIKSEIITLRKRHKIKLPDAIIAATSIYLKLPLITADLNFSKISTLKCILFEK